MGRQGRARDSRRRRHLPVDAAVPRGRHRRDPPPDRRHRSRRRGGQSETRDPVRPLYRRRVLRHGRRGPRRSRRRPGLARAHRRRAFASAPLDRGPARCRLGGHRRLHRPALDVAGRALKGCRRSRRSRRGRPRAPRRRYQRRSTSGPDARHRPPRDASDHPRQAGSAHRTRGRTAAHAVLLHRADAGSTGRAGASRRHRVRGSRALRRLPPASSRRPARSRP